MEKSCLNCVREIRCDWSPAGDKLCCDDWGSEDLHYKEDDSERDKTIIQ